MPNGNQKLYAQTLVRTTQKCSKEYFLQDRVVVSKASAQLNSGVIFVVYSENPDEIAQATFNSPAEFISITGVPFQAIASGQYKHTRGVFIPASWFLEQMGNWAQLLRTLEQNAKDDKVELLQLCAEKDYDPKTPHIIPRTQEFFAHLERYSALMLIDCDIPKSEFLYPNQPVVLPSTAKELVNDYLVDLDEALLEAPLFCVPSSSSYICDKDGNLLKTKASYHLMIGVHNASDIPQLTEYLHLKAYEKYGYVITTSSGRQEARNFVDTKVSQAGRLDFACKSIFNDGLQRIVPKEELIWIPNGDAYFVPELERKLQAIRRKKETKFYIDKTTPEAKKYRDERKATHRSVNINKLIAKEPTLTREQAEKRYEEHQALLKDKTLPPDFILHFSEHETISAGELYTNYQDYLGKGLCSPSEPDYENYKHCAQVLTRSGKKAIGDHHLGVVYELQEPTDASYDDVDEDDSIYTSNITNTPYRDCIIAFIAHHRSKDLFELEQDQEDASGQQMRVVFDDVIWYFKRKRLHITALQKQTIPKQTQTKLAKDWGVMYGFYEGQVASHNDEVMARISGLDNSQPTVQISDLLTQANPPRRQALIGGTGTGKSYGAVKHLGVPLAIQRAIAIVEHKSLNAIERPIFIVPAKANIATYANYFQKELEAYQQAHGRLSDEVLAVLKDPTKVVRYTRDEKKALGVKSTAEVLEVLQDSCIIFTTYAYLQRRAFLNYTYVLPQLIAKGGCLVVADEVHALHTACQKTYFQDANFYDASQSDDDPVNENGIFSMDFSSPAPEKATTDEDEEDSEGGDGSDDDEGAHWRVSCPQSANLRQNKTPDLRICQNCEFKEDAWWITARERETSDGEVISRLLPAVKNTPIHPTDLAIGRNSPLRYEISSSLYHPKMDLHYISQVQYRAPFAVGGVQNTSVIKPMHIADIINRKLPTKKDPKVNYQDEFAKTLAGAMHLQIMKAYPTYITMDDNRVETIHRITRDELQKRIPDGAYFPRVGCGLAMVKFFDPFAFQALGLANRLILMSATVSDEMRSDINKLLPNLDWQNCQGLTKNLGTAQIVLFHEKMGIDERLEVLDRWVAQEPVSREMLVVRSRKSAIYKSAREHEKYVSVANYLNEVGKQVGYKKVDEYRLHHTYARHPMCTGQNLPFPIAIFEVDHFQPFYASLIAHDNPIWDESTKPESERLSPDELWDEIELAIRREWLDLLIQALGRPMRLNEGNPEDKGHRLYILVNAPLIHSASGQKHLLTLDDISPKILQAFNERFQKVVEVYAPANQRNGKHLMPLLEQWVDEPTKALEVALTGRNARKRRLTPMEKKRARIDELVEQGLKKDAIKEKLNLRPSKFKGKETVLQELLDYLEAKIPL